jgi:hypothetical protein
VRTAIVASAEAVKLHDVFAGSRDREIGARHSFR